ncbi:MAG: primosomal replication protein N [Burkholderiales bacterium]|jgi:primosomal replication protein N|nr:primosomal replication protein N [Burkholderiales bacterium]
MNRLIVDVILAQKKALRYTAAGIEALEVTFTHESQQTEEGEARQVSFEITAVAFGQMALALQRVEEHKKLHCEGFLCRRSKTASTLRLHLTAFEVIE